LLWINLEVLQKTRKTNIRGQEPQIYPLDRHFTRYPSPAPHSLEISLRRYRAAFILCLGLLHQTSMNTSRGARPQREPPPITTLNRAPVRVSSAILGLFRRIE
jgi:hypothetical protein